MPELLFFVLELFTYLVLILTIIGCSYWLAYTQWILPTKNYFDIFKNQPNFEKICFLNKKNKQRYLIFFYIFAILNILPLYFSSWILVITPNINFNYVIGFITTFIILFILSYVWLYFLIKKFLKEINKIGIVSREEAINNFQNFKNEIISTLKPAITFKILKNNKKAMRNGPFQWHQKRFRKKIIKLKQKKLLEKKQNNCLLNIFVTYLKIHSLLLKIMKSEFNANYAIEINNEIQNINELPTILINNFFAYIEETK